MLQNAVLFYKIKLIENSLSFTMMTWPEGPAGIITEQKQNTFIQDATNEKKRPTNDITTTKTYSNQTGINMYNIQLQTVAVSA